MYDQVLMRMRGGRQHLLEEFQSSAEREGMGVGVFVQRAAFDVFQREIGLTDTDVA